MNSDSPDFSVAIFSFNRGRYLRNLLGSLEKHFPNAKVYVFDDGSDDPETKKVLETCSAQVYVNSSLSNARHGNLYTNMQSALQLCETRFLLLLQDDTQIVRNVSDLDVKVIEAVFADPSVAFIRPQFLKSAHANRFLSSTLPNYELGVLNPIRSFDEVELGNAFCDVVLCDVEKLRSANWKFLDSERANQKQAQALFSAMPFMFFPFVFYCPEVPSYRDRKLYLASRIVQKKRQGTPVCFKSIEGDELRAFFSREKDAWPIAENYLGTNLDDVVRPFVFQDYARSPWLHALYKIESRLWRMASPFRHFFSKSA